ncbi:protein of unknown function [Maridesulfovibrio hydrothermalis AM13 = DSM 14728]|uniref:Uncharacterized protein n=1 Tax=Maridesulfovibrio hydrothermalis AM13 = DSM 14728 TaxID=1121451 RepID=L0REM0_9BACT|nr:protein of unknown function [Maridesulfovibrio hydrothermalis AM13 = DSM 14728]
MTFFLSCHIFLDSQFYFGLAVINRRGERGLFIDNIDLP